VENTIQLSDVIVGLRAELLKAQEKAEKEELRFKVEGVEVEMKIGTTRSGSVDGKLSFLVVELGAKGAIDTQQLQTIRLKLSPTSSDGGDTLIGDRQTK
jgi:hypothetical protein